MSQLNVGITLDSTISMGAKNVSTVSMGAKNVSTINMGVKFDSTIMGIMFDSIIWMRHIYGNNWAILGRSRSEFGIFPAF